MPRLNNPPPRRPPGRPPKHGYAGTPIYTKWLHLRAACNNPNHHNYATHGGRGISYPQEWDTFTGFLEDVGEPPQKDLILRRKDLSKDYSKDNCYWASESAIAP